jgi:hypothetical protein
MGIERESGTVLTFLIPLLIPNFMPGFQSRSVDALEVLHQKRVRADHPYQAVSCQLEPCEILQAQVSSVYFTAPSVSIRSIGDSQSAVSFEFTFAVVFHVRRAALVPTLIRQVRRFPKRASIDTARYHQTLFRTFCSKSKCTGRCCATEHVEVAL